MMSTKSEFYGTEPGLRNTSDQRFIFNFRWTGIRDDLMFLLDEELSNVCLCALHSEMRNTEQLLGSLGLFAYRCNSLTECDEAIGQCGPEMSRGKERITVKLRKGQQTAVDKNNISVASFSGIIYYL